MRLPTRTASSLLVVGLTVAVAATGLGASTAAIPGASPNDATEAGVVRLTTSLLEHSQFAHRPFDGALAAKLVDRYMDSLDGSRSLFLQTDAEDFARLGATLPRSSHDSGDPKAAHAIFGRYIERLKQQVAYVNDALRTASFDFSGHDVYSFDREHAARPRDMDAARALWLQRLRAEYLQEKLGGKRPEQIVAGLTKRYAEQLQTMSALKSDEVLAIYLDTLAHVYDPHSDYLGREQMEDFAIAMRLSLAGIGATLERSDGYCRIHDLVPGGPAARAGLLKPGDRIVAVAQAGKAPVDITNMPLSRAVELIRGPKGSTVTLSVLPAGAVEGSPPEAELLTRDNVKLEDQEAKAKIVDLSTGKGAPVRLGVIDLPSFYADMGDGGGHRSATADVARLLDKLKSEHVRGIVLDLRRNGGGSLQEAISLTGLFLREGPVVQTRDPAGSIDVGSDTDPAVDYDGPLVVLTSRYSASASEILTGALQDYGRAVVVGDSSTFGKGTVQDVMPLARIMDQVGLGHRYDPGALKVTISKFYRPSGASTQLRGVASDIVLPSTSDLSDVSESSMKDPLPWDTVPAAPYAKLNRVEPYVATLREWSARRVAGESAFRDVAGDVALLRKELVTKAVSLNERQRREELAQAKARRGEREREEQALLAASPTTYAITLENAGLPGLPSPVSTLPKATAAPSKATSADGATDALDDAATRSLTDDVVLNESERILADYVGLLGDHSPKAIGGGS